MSLPKIKVKTFDITLPSDGSVYKFRPFSMGEQKLLMMALESGEEMEMIDALKQVISTCSIEPKVNPNKLSSFDLDWILLKLRERSVGEVMEIMIGHQGRNDKGEIVNANGIVCDHVNLVGVDIRKAELKRDPNHKKKIILQDEPLIGVSMKYPTAEMVQRMSIVDGTRATDFIFEFVSTCIEFVYTEDEVFETSTMSLQEVQAFLLQFDQDTVMKIFSDFFDTSPKVEMKFKYRCPKCNTDEEVALQGLRNFF